jgi:polar amino acid transport system substrate-binding protein
MKKRITAFLCMLTVIIAVMTGCGKTQKTIVSFADAERARIGAMTGSTGEQLAHEKFPNADIKSFDEIMDAVTALQSDQIDAVVTAYPTVIHVCKNNPDLTYLSEPVANEETAIALRKGDDELLAQVNGILTGLEEDGTLADMRRRWFKTEATPYETVNIPLPESGEPIRVGVNAAREPFSFVDENQEVSGHDGELARRIAAKMNRPVEFVDMTFSALLPALQSGKIDMIITGMTATDERRKSVNFSRKYFDNAQMLLVKKAASAGNNEKMSGIADIADKRIGVYEGAIHDAFVQENYPEAELSRFNATADMVLSLKSQRIDVILIDAISARVVLKSNPELGILTDDVLTLPLGVGFRKDNPELRGQFNQFLKAIREDGTYDEMVARWCENDPEEAVMPEIENPSGGPTVVLGVAVADLPYVAVMNGEYVGFDIELLRRFAAYQGFRLEIMTLEFPALVTALASGKVDMIADGIAITEERQKQVDFSDAYMDFKTAAVALKSNIAGMEGEAARSASGPAFFEGIADSFYNNVIYENRYLMIFDGLKTTGIISLFSILFGTLLGGVVCFLRMCRYKALNAVAKTYIAALRGTPVLVLLMLIFYVVFASLDINPVLVAVVAFGMNFAAQISEVYRVGIEGVDRGQAEAGVAMGFTKTRTFLYIVLPQAVRQILPVYKGEIISLVKATSIVGYIAVQDLTKAGDIIRSRTFDAFFPLIMVAVLYFAITELLILVISHIERKNDPKAKKRQVKKAL